MRKLSKKGRKLLRENANVDENGYVKMPPNRKVLDNNWREKNEN